MSTYKSKPATVPVPAETVSDKFADLSKLSSVIDQLPDDQRSKVGDVQFGTDTLTINTAQVGAIQFKVVERTPARVVFSAIGSPVPLQMTLNLSAIDPQTTELVTSIDVDIPMMLRPMVGGPLQKAAEQFNDLLANSCAH